MKNQNGKKRGSISNNGNRPSENFNIPSNNDSRIERNDKQHNVSPIVGRPAPTPPKPPKGD